MNHVENYQIPYESTEPRPCECSENRLLTKYCLIEGLTEEERKCDLQTATIDNSNVKQFEMASELIKNIDYYIANGRGFYIYGDPVEARKYNLSAFGTGKTFLTHCIANQLNKLGIPGLCVTEHKLLQDIKDSYGPNSKYSESEILDRYQNAPVLLIDDLFSEQYKDWGESKLFNIIDYRSRNNKLTIINSNYSPERISQRLPINGEKMASRITGNNELLMMIGKDRRQSR
jgi:DNA replication protein DnaC